MRTLQRYGIAITLIGSLALPCFADVIHLKDGTRLEGDIKKTDDGYRVTDSAGTVTTVSSDRIDSIEPRPKGGADASAARLASLRRAVENLDDIRKILDRYTSFMTQNAGTPATKDAQADIDAWHDRQAKGLVKVGTKWMTTEERDGLQEKSLGVADQLRQTIKQGRIKEATTVLDNALADNPTNISLLYLRGVLLYRQEQLPPSRKAFESVAAAAGDHAPTLNNLAVILYRQNAPVAALAQYDRAMLAAPGSREILDNVAEALNALPEAERKSSVVKKVVRHFKEQDDDLQKKMSERGMVRWGATWVTDAQYAKLQEQERQIKDKLDEMSRNYDSVQAGIVGIDRRIRDDQEEMRLIDQATLTTDSEGRVVRLPYPARYYDIRREVAALLSERAARVADLDHLRRDAKAVQQQLPVARYTGIQKIIDADGMPVLAMRPPQTRPAREDVAVP